MRAEVCRGLFGALAFVALTGGSVGLAQEAIDRPGRRIVGGEPTDIRNHPWQVALKIRNGAIVYRCGGTVIARQWILSAAHCFPHGTQAADVEYKVGVTHYAADGSWATVDDLIVHSAYDSKTKANDIALIRTSPLAVGRTIALPENSTLLTSGQPLEITGWGDTTGSGDISDTLMKAEVPYVENDECNSSISYARRVGPGMLCAGHRDGGVDSCQGDSGGPLVWRRPSGNVLVGVVSWGDGCALRLKYGVYTRVSYYLDWISRHIQLHSVSR